MQTALRVAEGWAMVVRFRRPRLQRPHPRFSTMGCFSAEARNNGCRSAVPHTQGSRVSAPRHHTGGTSMGERWTTSVLPLKGGPCSWLSAVLLLVAACARAAPESSEPPRPSMVEPPATRAVPTPQGPLEAPNEASVEQRFEYYLSAYRDLDYSELEKELKLQPPKPSGLSFDPTQAECFDLVNEGLKLTKEELETLRLRGMVSVDHVQPYSMGSAYYSIWARDLPVLITTDSILHALHRSYDEVIQELEVSLFS